MDFETGCVDNLFEKPGADGRRALGKNARSESSGNKCSTARLNPLIGKVIRGNGVGEVRILKENFRNWLFTFIKGKLLTQVSFQKKFKSMANSVLNDFSTDVFYSLKKKNRWETLNSVNTVLKTVRQDSPSFAVSAVERNPTGHLSKVSEDKEVLVYGRLRANSKRIEKVAPKGRDGAPLASLEDSLAWKSGHKNKRSQRREVKSKQPEMTIVIDRPGYVRKPLKLEDEDALVPVIEKKVIQKSKKVCGQFLNDDFEEFYDDEEYEISDEEFADDFCVETNEAVEESNSFQLLDFIKFSSEKKERVHMKKIKDMELIDGVYSEPSESKSQDKPFNKYEILKNSSFFSKELDLNSYFLKPENFVPKLKTWAEINNQTIKIMWMDKEKTSCFIDFSRILESKNLIAVVGFTLLENNQVVRITFNTDFPFEYPGKEFQEYAEEEREFGSFFDLILDCLKESSNPVLLKRTNFKPFEEAFQCKSGTAIESFNDYELIQRFSNPKEAIVSSSDSCEFCDHKNALNLIKLTCNHSLCLSCAGLTFRSQIFNHSKELVCPICEAVQDLMNLTTVIPLSLIRAFLKENFTKLSTNKVQECPRCFGHFEKVSETSLVRCEPCHIAFCQDCLQSPHFPISCDQMRTWSSKFKQQRKLMF